MAIPTTDFEPNQAAAGVAGAIRFGAERYRRTKGMRSWSKNLAKRGEPKTASELDKLIAVVEL